jgi:hypothetical protein
MKPGQNIILKTNASNEQLQRALESALPGAVAQTKEIAPQFKGATDSDTCRKIFDYLKKRVQYDKDGFTQKIKYPSALLRDGRGDCKSYSLFTGAILKNLNIPFRWTYASYTPGVKTPGHVYITTDSGCICDVVWGKFNSEKKPYNKFYKSMNISYISGVDPAMGATVAGKFLKNVGAGVKKAATNVSSGAAVAAIKGATLAPGRNLFRLIVQNNMDGIASKLAKMNQAQILDLWKKVGGEPGKIAADIRNGANKPVKKLGLLGVVKKKLAAKGIKGLGATDDQVISALGPAATAAGTAVGAASGPQGAAVGAASGASLAEVLKQLIPLVQQLLAATPASDQTDTLVAQSNITAPADLEPTGSSAAPGGNNMLLYAAAAAAAIIFLPKLLK